MKIDRLTKETFGSIQDSLLKRSANSYPKQEAAVAECRRHPAGDQENPRLP